MPINPLPTPHKAYGRLGQRVIDTMTLWGKHCLKDGPIQWVSYMQLLITYQQATKLQGPVRDGKLWHEPNLQGTTLVPRTLRQRTKWFKAALNALWDEQGISYTVAFARPESEILCAWLQCVSVPWPQARHEAVELWLGQHLPQGVLRRTTQGAGYLPQAGPVALLRIQTPPSSSLLRWMRRT